MNKIITVPAYILSEKEIKDLERRVRVAKLLRVGETWEKIKKATGAHLQTIALVSKRLKLTKTKKGISNQKSVTSSLFSYGQSSEPGNSQPLLN